MVYFEFQGMIFKESDDGLYLDVKDAYGTAFTHRANLHGLHIMNFRLDRFGANVEMQLTDGNWYDSYGKRV